MTKKPEPTHDQLKVLTEVVATLDPMVQVILCGPLEQLNSSLNNKSRILKLIQDALSHLHLDMKYLMFDLESTRRERDEYKQQLENR